jgi:hypothetical protein
MQHENIQNAAEVDLYYSTWNIKHAAGGSILFNAKLYRMLQVDLYYSTWKYTECCRCIYAIQRENIQNAAYWIYIVQHEKIQNVAGRFILFNIKKYRMLQVELYFSTWKYTECCRWIYTIQHENIQNSAGRLRLFNMKIYKMLEVDLYYSTWKYTECYRWNYTIQIENIQIAAGGFILFNMKINRVITYNGRVQAACVANWRNVCFLMSILWNAAIHHKMFIMHKYLPNYVYAT